MYTVSALFYITVPFFVFAPPNENTFRRPCVIVKIDMIKEGGKRNAFIIQQGKNTYEKQSFRACFCHVITFKVL